MWPYHSGHGVIAGRGCGLVTGSEHALIPSSGRGLMQVVGVA